VLPQHHGTHFGGGGSEGLMQHLSIKIFAQPGAQLVAGDAIAVFHRWIQKRDFPDLLIDVADYSHIAAGPGVVLMGRAAAYSLDSGGERLGLLYNRRMGVILYDEASLQQAYESALGVCRRLEVEAEFHGKLKFDSKTFTVTWNDRLLYPNTEESWTRLRPTVETFLAHKFGAGAYNLRRNYDLRERLGAEVVA
jgi:hypothetical protein